MKNFVIPRMGTPFRASEKLRGIRLLGLGMETSLLEAVEGARWYVICLGWRLIFIVEISIEQSDA